MKNTVSLILILIGTSCSKNPEEPFIGKWQILNVVENNESIDLNENWMHLKTDGTFNSYDGNSDKNEKGNWTYIASEKVLSINSELDDDDSEWVLSFKNDTLIFSATEGNLYLIAVKME